LPLSSMKALSPTPAGACHPSPRPGRTTLPSSPPGLDRGEGRELPHPALIGGGWCVTRPLSSPFPRWLPFHSRGLMLATCPLLSGGHQFPWQMRDCVSRAIAPRY
jgi:hypothetical protein